MPKLLVWIVRLALLLLAPLFLLCAGVVREMKRLDAWAADQLAVEPVVGDGEVRRDHIHPERT